MSAIKQLLCSLVGHTWECWRFRDGRVIGYQCAHCCKFSKSRPTCTISRIYE